MSWERPSDDKPELDPWGRKKNENNPILDVKNNKKFNKISLKKNFLEFLKKIIFVSKSPKKLFKISNFFILFIIIFFIWFISGFYKIKESEEGVAIKFGKFSHLIHPGLNWKFTFIDQIYIINVKKIRELFVSDIILTSDEKLIYAQMSLHYHIIDPKNYLFKIINPDKSFKEAVDSALRLVIGRSEMNYLLTRDKVFVQNSVKKEIEDIIHPYNIGINILDVSFQTLQPPKKVKPSFDEVFFSIENKKKCIHEAKIYLEEMQLKAKNEAQNILERAKICKFRKILKAQGEAERFAKMIPLYKTAKKFTLQKLYIESMEKLLSHTRKILIDQKNNILFLLSMDKSTQKKDKNILSDKIIKNIPFKIKIIPTFDKKKKNNDITYFSKNRVLEQRKINSVRNNVKREGRE